MCVVQSFSSSPLVLSPPLEIIFPPLSRFLSVLTYDARALRRLFYNARVLRRLLCNARALRRPPAALVVLLGQVPALRSADRFVCGRLPPLGAVFNRSSGAQDSAAAAAAAMVMLVAVDRIRPSRGALSICKVDGRSVGPLGTPCAIGTCEGRARDRQNAASRGFPRREPRSTHSRGRTPGGGRSPRGLCTM